MRASTLVFAALTLGALSVAHAQAQVPVAMDLRAGAAPALSAEPGYPALPQALWGVDLSVSLGGPAFLTLEGGASWLSPSSFSSNWMRYRGFAFFSLKAGAGWRLVTGSGPLELSLLAGANLARYDLSYSYFYFPSVMARLSLPPLVSGPRLDLLPALCLPLLLRADSTSVGLELSISLRWRPSALPATALGASS